MNGDGLLTTARGDMTDAVLIRQAVEAWVIARDQGDWEGLRAVWHPDGIMVATWFQGPATDFIEASRRGWESGAVVHHFLGGSRSNINGTRAVVQTKMTLGARANVHGVPCDITCMGRFFDRFLKVNGHWLLSHRQLIYEKDRLDTVRPGDRLELEPELLNRFPPGYRHLAYVQVNAGQSVLENLPGLRGEAVEKLYRDGDHWLATGETAERGAPVYPTYHFQMFQAERAK